jgi:hypothetical protein
MKTVYYDGKVSVVIDPNNVYPKLKASEIFESLGLIPHFFIHAVTSPNLLEAMCREYGFGCFPFEGFTIAEDGTLSYPGDPDLHPLAKFTHGEDVMYQYRYGMVNVNGVIVRMD